MSLQLVGLVATLLRIHPSPQSPSLHMTPAQFWHPPFGTDQRMPTAGDVDGDGHADLVSLWPTGDGVIDIARTSSIGKPIYGSPALGGFGRDALGGAAGPFVRKDAADYVGIFSDGSVRVAWGMPPGTNQYQHNDLAGQIPNDVAPKGAVKTAVADFDGDGKTDVLVLDATGKLLLLRNTRKGDGAPGFTPFPLQKPLTNVSQFAAGRFGSESRGQCVWMDEKGQVTRATLDLANGTTSLGKGVPVTTAQAGEHIAVGHFRGEKVDDILVGQQLLPNADATAAITLSDLPLLPIAKDDGPWVAADIDGNGKDDLVRFHRGSERFIGLDTYVHFSYGEGEDKGYFSSTNDGLPDVWKTGKIKPGGMDLAALGCKVGHRDLLIEIERFDDVNEPNLRSSLDQVTKYFASLPIRNPDGTNGIAIHFIYKKPYAKSERDQVMGHFDDIFPPLEHRGIVHTMFAENNGPLVAKINGDNGHFNGNWPEFLHEFGHQLNLTHDGHWGPSYCALYPSLMSYSYSYSLNDRREDIGYSDGSRASFQVNELHLSEQLPFPYEKVKFLAGSPYHFHIKAGADGKSTLVDWNWNGIYGEPDVCADINYSHGMDFGPHQDFPQIHSEPVLVAHGEGAKPRILLFYGQAASKLVRPVMRSWLGKDRDADLAKWSDEIVLDTSSMDGDPTATYLDGTTWVAYTTLAGVNLCPITVDAEGKAHAGQKVLVPQSTGAHPTLTSFDGRLALLLWRDANTPVGLRLVRPSGGAVKLQPEAALSFQSDVPVGAVAGAKTIEGASLWIGRIELPGRASAGQTEVVRYQLGKDNLLRLAERRWVAGTYSHHRMSLLWQKDAGLGPQGRIYLFSGGITTPDKPWAEQYLTMSIAYPENGGWTYFKYYNNSFASVSAPGVCFYDGNIVYATRRQNSDPAHDGDLQISFYGSGASPARMGDFDDISHIRDFGLSHSIPYLVK